ncbi:hypothetical protein [Beggiatoa alba]|uniref:hypothetical protein n=1 Tax=Beggiatoa alba TaxID=1022 RepID=UPI0002D44C93|nr:hypothetical protein [Beggiatoa alba]
MKPFIILVLFLFSLPASACSLVRGGLTNEQVTNALFTICTQRFNTFDVSYCSLYATEHRDTQNCIYALSAPYGFVAYASVFGDLVEPVFVESATFEQHIYPFIYLGVMLSCGAALLLGLPFVRGK